MSSSRSKHRNEEGCQCDCHHHHQDHNQDRDQEDQHLHKDRDRDNEYTPEVNGFRDEEEDMYPNQPIKRLFSNKLGRTFETANISPSSTNAFENTMSSYGNKLRQQPRSSNDLMYRKDFQEEDVDGEEEAKFDYGDNREGKNYDDSIRNPSLTYQMKYEDEYSSGYDKYDDPSIHYQQEQEQEQKQEFKPEKAQHDKLRNSQRLRHEANNSNNKRMVDEEDKKKQLDYEQLASDFKELLWENDNLTYKLEKALKEKNAAIAMSNSLKRILDDYSNKSNIQGANEALKSLCIEENNDLREANNAYETMIDHAFDLLKYLSNKKGISMRPLSYYINNEDNFSNLLDDIHQSIKVNERNRDNEHSKQRFNNNKASERGNEVNSSTGKFPSSRGNNNHNEHNIRNDFDDNNYYPSNSKHINHDYDNNKQTFGANQDKERDRRFNNSNSIEDNSSNEYYRQKSNRDNKQIPRANSYNRERDSNEDIVHQCALRKKSKENVFNADGESDEDKDFVNKSKANSKRNEVLNNSHSQHGSDKKSQLKRANIIRDSGGENEDYNDNDEHNDNDKGLSKVNYDPPISNGKQLKGKTILASNSKSPQPNSKGVKSVNLKSFDKSSSQSQKGNSNSHKDKLQQNYPSITEKTNSIENTNENPNNIMSIKKDKGKGNLKSNKKAPSKDEMKTLDLQNFKSRFNIENRKKDLNGKDKDKDKSKGKGQGINKDKSQSKLNSELEQENSSLKRIDSLKPFNQKSQSLMEVKMKNDPKVSTCSSPTKSDKIKKSKTFIFNSPRVQSPLRQDICIACSVDCNVSSNGYSPMTYVPYGSKVLRKSVTPVVYPL